MLALSLAATAVVCAGCGNKNKEEQATAVPPPPAHGVASSDELTTNLGAARALNEQVAPSGVRWTRAYPLDEKRVLIAGELVNETIAIVTDDGGATWRLLRSERDAWSSWAVTADGAIVLAMGGRDGAPTPTTAPVAGAKLAFAGFTDAALTTPTPAFPDAAGPVAGYLQMENALPALVGPDSAALIGSDGPKKSFLIYGGKPGAEAVPSLKLPPAEKFVTVPYGRHASLLSIKGKELFQRPFPPPGKPLDKPTKIPMPVTPTTLAELSVLPGCDTGAWSFQKVKQANGFAMLGVSHDKTVVFPLPESTAAASRVGCGAGRIVVETITPKTGVPATWASQPDVPTMISCDLAGKCVIPKNAPFRLWPEQHKREIAMATTEQGVLAVLTAHAGERWGLYLAQGPKNGILYERQRPIGEGNSDRGRLDLGALVSLGKRAILLVSADVTGTSRRGWFVLVSDDGGTNWGPP